MCGTANSIVKGVGQVAGATLDPFNISGHGGIPGVNSGGNGLIGDFNGANSRDAAIAAQRGATGQAVAALTPWEAQGRGAMNSLAANDFMGQWQTDPGYQFQLAEGQKAINNSMAARGLGGSGAASKDLLRFSQGLANQTYQQGYQNNLQRLGMLSGYGSNAAGNIANAHTGLGNAQAAAHISQGNQNSNLLGQVVGAGAAFFSDARLKKDLRPITKEEREEMSKVLKAYGFKYLSDEHGSGEWIGVLAQDLEKSEVGKLLVVENEQGLKTIDQNKVLSMFLAYMAEVA